MTEIDWHQEVEARKDDMMKDLKELLAIPSVREDDKATADAPVGPGPKAALEKFLSYGDRDGFVTKNVGNLAGHIQLGDGDETLGVFGHVDVVPVGSGWNTDPFVPVVKDGKLYARGSSDDKGPSIAAYYGMKIIKELNLPLSKRIRFIIGTDEESGWKCMDHYLTVEEKPDFGFSPDAEFPIINGEKGMATIGLHFRGDNSGDYTLELFEAGQRENVVPEEAVAIVDAPSVEAAKQMEEDFSNYLKQNTVISGSIKVNDVQVEVRVKGKAAHAMEPKNGVNAGTYLTKFLTKYKFGGSAKTFLKTSTDYLHEDSRGVKIGAAHTDPVMGELTMNPGLFSFKAGDGVGADNFIVLNIRFPQGVTSEGLEIAIESTVGLDGVVVMSKDSKVPHYVSPDDPLVKTLLEVYEEHTGEKGYEQVIGGGTYGRLLERGVAFGAMFPGREDTMHQANEYMLVDDIIKSAEIYADAIYRLAK